MTMLLQFIIYMETDNSVDENGEISNFFLDNHLFHRF